MSRIAYKTLLCNTISSVHGVNARWLTVTRVDATDKGKVVWSGDVDTFELINHPQAKACYAWSLEAGEMTVILTALKTPPVTSAQLAIQTAYAEGKLDPKKHLPKK